MGCLGMPALLEETLGFGAESIAAAADWLTAPCGWLASAIDFFFLVAAIRMTAEVAAAAPTISIIGMKEVPDSGSFSDASVYSMPSWSRTSIAY